MKYVLHYETDPVGFGKARELFPSHQARYQRFVDDGTLLMIGTFANPLEDGAMGIFTTREAAEEFARGDPFVTEGVVRDWQLREWNEVLA
jgi:uncharacterized protein YciI